MLVMYVGWKVLKRTKVVKLREMDLVTDTYPEDSLDPGLETEKSAWRAKAYDVWRWLL